MGVRSKVGLGFSLKTNDNKISNLKLVDGKVWATSSSILLYTVHSFFCAFFAL